MNISVAMDAIIDHLATQSGEDVHDTENEDELLGNLHGLFKPFYIMYFGGPVRAAHGRGITSSRNDVNIMWCQATAVAPTKDSRNLLLDKAINILTGWHPPDSGEMILEGGMAFSIANTTVRPSKYMKNLTWTYRTNLTLVQ